MPETFHSDGGEGQGMKLQKFQWGGWTSGKIVDRSGERFVELLNDATSYKIHASVDRKWAELKKSPSEERLDCILDPTHWLTALPAIDLPEEIKDRFFANFTEPEAIRNRRVAHRGLTAANYSKEAELVDAVLSYGDQKKGIFEGKRDAIHDPELLMINAHSICEDFCELIEEGNIPALRRIINIVENGMRVPISQRGGHSSVAGQMLLQFSSLHIYSRSLPTKKQLREACGLGDRADEKVATKMMKDLGLFGLPTAREV
jgi:hypothetical protein